MADFWYRPPDMGGSWDARRLTCWFLVIAGMTTHGCDSSDDSDKSDLETWRGPLPEASLACTEVCQHLAGSCDASVDGCIEQCAAYVPLSEACAAAHDSYLECMKTVEVACRWASIETTGCDDERDKMLPCGGR